MEKKSTLAREKIEKVRLLQNKVRELEEDLRIREELPHLFLFKHYTWSREFFECTEDEQFLCSANQIGKSSFLIRKNIEWATNKEMWPTLWPNHVPNQFWYFYPNFDTATAEWNTKWNLFMPRGSLKKHPIYGWEPQFDRKQIKAVYFNSGVTLYFKSYTQKLQDVQAGTIFLVSADEEMPIEFLPELQLRRAAVGGKFCMVFTATLGLDHWRRTIQPEKGEEELHPFAWKKQVSMYDCMFYEDGSPSHWTKEKIRKVEQSCGSQSEVLRRVYGKFVMGGGLRYECFDRERNTSPKHLVPTNWEIYAGIDYGSGGSGHPSAVVFVAVNPQRTKARVIKSWRGDGQVITASGLVEKYKELVKESSFRIVVASYDSAARDFFTIASGQSISVTPAIKKTQEGTEILNSLFKNAALKIQIPDPENEKLCTELSSLQKLESKTQAQDDLADALRYAIMPIAFDWDTIVSEYLDSISEDTILAEKKEDLVETQAQAAKRRLDERRGIVRKESVDNIESELEAWGELHEY